MTAANAINSLTTGLVIHNPTIFNTTTITQHDVLVGAAINNITSVALANQQLLVGNTSADPSGKSLSIVNQVFTSSGTYTPTSGMIFCQIQIIGGGGAGGGAATTGAGQISEGTGGGAGEYASGIFSATTIGASQTVTIGAAGSPSAGLVGGNGGTTSVGTLITAVGGSGGPVIAAATSGNLNGGGGGTGGTGGDYRFPGQIGGQSIFSNALFNLCGYGGNSNFGSGGGSSTGTTGNGVAGTGFGTGGGGAANLPSQAVTRSGGSGTKGVVIITEYVLA